MDELGVDKGKYQNAFKISDEDDFQHHLRQSTNSCFVYNYFDVGLLAWESNTGIQPVHKNYKAVTYRI